MRREKTYFDTKFDQEVISSANVRLRELADGDPSTHELVQRIVQTQANEGWEFDTDQEFFDAYRGNVTYAVFERHYTNHRMTVLFKGNATQVSLRAPSRSEVLSLAEPFEEKADTCRLPVSPRSERPSIFIGHGRSPLWRDLKDHLHDHHHFEVQAYEIGARAGHTIRDVLEEMLLKSSFALLVMTGEDMDAAGGLHARENVVHETGLFQGRLGFTRAIVLLEEGTYEFSNIHGINQVRFSRGNIRETYGEVLATIRREFGGV